MINADMSFAKKSKQIFEGLINGKSDHAEEIQKSRDFHVHVSGLPLIIP